MKLENREIVLWAPRVVGIGLALFLSLFALDAFSGSDGVLPTITALLMGLIPAMITLAAVIIGWRHQGIAAIIFFAGALFYTVNALDHPDWILIITGPLLLEGALFSMSWRQSRQSHPSPKAI